MAKVFLSAGHGGSEPGAVAYGMKEKDINGFKLVDEIHIKDDILLKSKQEIYDLFTMTPYYYKTSKEDTEKLLKLESLTTTVHFAIEIYKKVGF